MPQYARIHHASILSAMAHLDHLMRRRDITFLFLKSMTASKFARTSCTSSAKFQAGVKDVW